MCDFDMPRVYHDKIRKARKPHKCCECRHEISKGAYYLDINGEWNGEFEQYKRCLDCLGVIESLQECVAFGYLNETLIESGHLKCVDSDGDEMTGEDGYCFWESAENWLEVACLRPLKVVLIGGKSSD